MPRPSWKGFLRLSLVSCPVYLTPATTRAKSTRLHQVWVPDAPRSEPAEVDDEHEAAAQLASRPSRHQVAEADQGDAAGPATRIALQPIDRDTGEVIDRAEVVKGYEFERGRYVTFTPAELKALDVESTRVIDLATFVPRAEVDPLYYNAGYYIYPDGAVATEAYRVITAAMTEAGVAGLAPLAGANGWSWSSRVAAAWRLSRCTRPKRSGQHSSTASEGKPRQGGG